MQGFQEGGPTTARTPTLVNVLNERLVRFNERIDKVIRDLDYIHHQLVDEPPPNTKVGPFDNHPKTMENTVNILNVLESSINRLEEMSNRFQTASH